MIAELGFCNGQLGILTFEEKLTLGKAVKHGRQARLAGQRGARMARDVKDVAQGKPRQRDRAGRPKLREWERPWVQNAVWTGVGGLGVVAAHKTGAYKAAKNAVDRVRNRHLESDEPLIAFAVNPMPKFLHGYHMGRQGAHAKTAAPLEKKAASPGGLTQPEIERLGKAWKESSKSWDRASKHHKKGHGDSRINRTGRWVGENRNKVIAGGATAATAAGGVMVANRLESLEPVIVFHTDPTRVSITDADGKETFRVSDVRGKGARITAASSKTRKRRKKKPHERIENERARHNAQKVIAGAGAATLAVGSMALANKLRTIPKGGTFRQGQWFPQGGRAGGRKKTPEEQAAINERAATTKRTKRNEEIQGAVSDTRRQERLQKARETGVIPFEA